MDDSRIKDAASLLRAFFDEGQLKKGGQFAAFSSSWKSIVGEQAAAHSRVADVDRGSLVVEAEHPGWIQILQLRQAEILAAVRQRYPELELRGVSFRLAKDKPGPSAPGERAARPGPFGPEGRAIPEGPEDEARPSSPDMAAKPAPSLEALEDSDFKKSLESLRKAMEGKSR
jgi:hypothetical protein